MIIWFAVLFSIGIWRITFDLSILHAFNPWEALSYLIREKQRGFIQMGTDELFEKLYLMYFRLGGVFLSVTGLEALYADLGKRVAFFQLKNLE
jgi:KUP system potassium uptake protein